MERKTLPGYCLASKPVNRAKVGYAMRGALRDVALAQAGVAVADSEQAPSWLGCLVHQVSAVHQAGLFK